MKKRLLAGIISLCMVVSLIPTSVFAAETGTEQPAVSQAQTMIECLGEETPEDTECKAEIHVEGCNKFVEVKECIEGCTLEAGHEDDCVFPIKCTEEGCILEFNHDGEHKTAEEPVMTLAETDDTSVAEVRDANELIEAINDEEIKTINLIGENDEFNIGTETLSINRPLTINGNGKKIKGSGSVDSSIFKVFSDATFNNIIIESAAQNGRCINTRTDNIKVFINKSELTATGGGNPQPLNVAGDGEKGLIVDIDNTIINAGDSGYGITPWVPATINIKNNSIINGYAALYIKGGSGGVEINVKDSELIGINKHPAGSNNFCTIAFDDTGFVNIEGGIVKAITSNTSEQSIFDGYYDNGSIITLKDTEIICEGDNAVVCFDGDNYYKIKASGKSINAFVAKVGEYYYPTLEVAIVVANNGDTIVLNKDVELVNTLEITKSVTIDLNGHAITSTGTTILNNGRLVIKDTSVAKTGLVKSTGNVAVAVGDNSLTTIEGGKFESREGAVITGYAQGATININGGEFYAEDNAVVAGNGNRTNGSNQVRTEANIINISGGKFVGNIESDGYIACGIYAPWKDNITVSGGEFIVNGGAGIVARAGNVTVNGGKFTVTGTAKGGVGDKSMAIPSAVFVFDATKPDYPAITDTDKIKVTGGEFKSDYALAEVIAAKDSDESRRMDISVEYCQSTFDDTNSHKVYDFTHTFGNWTTVKAPTCGAKGKEQHVCTVCGKTETKDIAATGNHSYGAWQVSSKPTCTTAGSNKSVCSVCGHERYSPIAATGHSYGSDGRCTVCGDYDATKVVTTPPAASTTTPTTPTTPVPAKPATTPETAETTPAPVENAKPETADTTITKVEASEEVIEAVKETVKVEEGTAKVETETIEKVIEATEEGKEVVLPLTQVTEEAVNKAEVSADALEKVAEKEADVVIQLTDVTVKLDAVAIAAVAEQAQGKNIEIRAVKTETVTLTEKQQDALADKETAIVVTAQIFADGEYIGDFKGGTATIMLPFTPEEGRAAEDYKVYFVDDDGNLTPVAAEYVDGHMVFTTGHFSDYAIVYEKAEAVEDSESDTEVVITPEEEASEGTSLPIIPIIVVIAIIVIGGIVLVMRKKKEE